MRVRLLASALAFAATLPLGGQAATEPRMPGPAPSPRRPGAAAENARCEGCHVEIAGEWRASLHHRAHTDPVYRRALAIEPLAFCRGCHAPEADPAADPPAEIGALGVGCVTCHAAAEGVLSAPGSGDPTSPAPHPVIRAAAFATAAACASCHEFSFPDPERRTRPELMQSTASEHRGSRFAAVSCAGCHMPLVPGRAGKAHRGHAFTASREPAILRAAVRATAARVDAGSVEVRLAPAGAGHAFPTGDLFRRLSVLAKAVGAEQQVVASDVRWLARRFGRAKGRDGRPIKVLVSDSRVGADGDTIVHLSPGPEARGLPIAWRVAYQRVEHPIGDDTDAAVVEGEVEIARGILPP